MSKPTVFFSHSSKDERILQRLKASVLQKTSETVEIFLSSDGQSIPFGRNWVHKVEEALTASALMIVFVSPNSLTSHWLFFEAGFAYSKGVQVVPVGFLGIDLTQIPPPLGLLQGFNINSSNGLNNIIALVNRTFGYAHQESFTKQEYDEILGSDQQLDIQVLGQNASLVSNLVFTITLKEQTTTLAEIKDFLVGLAIPYQQESNTLTTFGISFETYGSGKNHKVLSITISPILPGFSFNLIDDLIVEIASSQPEEIRLYVNFVSQVQCPLLQHRIAAAFYKTGIELLTTGEFRIGDLQFKLEHSWTNLGNETYISAVYFGSCLKEMRLAELIDLLFERGVLYTTGKMI